VGYLVYNLWLQVQFQVAKSQTALDQLRCSNGFTAFTPSYPEAAALGEIFEAQPLSKVGMALLITFFCIYSLAYDKWEIKYRHDRKQIMLELHHLIKDLRATQRQVTSLMKADKGLIQHIRELDAQIEQPQEAGVVQEWYQLKQKQRIEEKKQRLQELHGNEEAVQVHSNLVDNTMAI